MMYIFKSESMKPLFDRFLSLLGPDKDPVEFLVKHSFLLDDVEKIILVERLLSITPKTLKELSKLTHKSGTRVRQIQYAILRLMIKYMQNPQEALAKRTKRLEQWRNKEVKALIKEREFILRNCNKQLFNDNSFDRCYKKWVLLSFFHDDENVINRIKYHFKKLTYLEQFILKSRYLLKYKRSYTAIRKKIQLDQYKVLNLEYRGLEKIITFEYEEIGRNYEELRILKI